MGSKSTYLRALFFVCLATGPVLMACEAALDFDRNKIQHYKSSDGAVQPSTDDSGSTEGDDSGTDMPDTGTGMPDTGTGIKDSGSDADAGT